MIAQAQCRSTHVTTNNLDALLNAEKCNSDGEIELKMATSRKPRKNKTKLKRVQGCGEEDTDKDNFNFSMNAGLAPESSSDEMSVEDSEDNDPVIISNVEVRRVHDHVYLTWLIFSLVGFRSSIKVSANNWLWF